MPKIIYNLTNNKYDCIYLHNLNIFDKKTYNFIQREKQIIARATSKNILF